MVLAIAAASAPRAPVPEKIRASAESSSHEIVNRCASIPAGGASSDEACCGEIWLAEIVTGVPVPDVLLALDTPGST